MQHHMEGVHREDFLQDTKTQDAAARCIEVLGEAANQDMQIEPDLAYRYPKLELRQAYAARNKLIHGYFGADPNLLWVTATASVPKLIEAAQAVLRDRAPKNSNAPEP